MSNVVDNIAMIKLDRDKIESIAGTKGVSLSGFARRCGISRQSLYNMFGGQSIFSAPLTKILEYTGLPPNEIISYRQEIGSVMKDAPEGIRKAAFALQEFAKENGADLFLIGSRAKGRKGIRADWDFAIFFSQAAAKKVSLAQIKQKVGDLAFPHRADVVDLTVAPRWFIDSVADEAIRVTGDTDIEDIFGKGRKDMEAA